MTAQRDRAAELRAVATDAVAKILRDLSDRRGLKQEWHRIDEDVQAEIRSTWESAVTESLSALVEAAPGEATFVSVEFACNKCGYCGRQGLAHNRKPGLSCEYEAVAFAASPPLAPERAEDRRDAAIRRNSRRWVEFQNRWKEKHVWNHVLHEHDHTRGNSVEEVIDSYLNEADTVAAMQADKEKGNAVRKTE